MKKPFLRDLQSQLLGTVTDQEEVLAAFSTDASIFTVKPTAVVYPKNTADVRRAVLTAIERTASDKPLSVTPRGNGTDTTGGALGAGLVLDFTAHMHKVMDMDRRTITVQPGASFWTVQQLLHAQARYLPVFPSSLHYSTIGGAVANNATGYKGAKYGSLRDYVRHVKVVLSDGSLVNFGKVSARELQRKKGQTDLEGSIYRKIDALVTDHRKTISEAAPKTMHNNAAYHLSGLKQSDGSINLAPLIAGSKGTLGVITEITLESLSWNPQVQLLVGYFDDIEKTAEAVLALKEIEPSAVELVDGRLIDYLKRERSGDLDGLVPEDTPRAVLLVEFDDLSRLQQLRKVRRASRVMARLATSQRSSDSVLEQEALWRIRQSAAAVLWMGDGSAAAPPVLEDAAVPVEKLGQLLTLAERMFEKHELSYCAWGHAGSGQIWFQPELDISKKKHTEKLESLLGDYHELVLSLGGTIAAAHGDGILRAPYLADQYGEKMMGLMKEVKEAFDPHGILNPLSKFAAKEQSAELLRTEYRLQRGYEYFPQ